MKDYATLCKGDVISFYLENLDQVISFEVLEVRSEEGPTTAIWIVDENLEVDFARPVDLPEESEVWVHLPVLSMEGMTWILFVILFYLRQSRCCSNCRGVSLFFRQSTPISNNVRLFSSPVLRALVFCCRKIFI